MQLCLVRRYLGARLYIHHGSSKHWLENCQMCLKQPCNSLTFWDLQTKGVKQCMAGKQLTGRLPLTFPLLYHILFYYLLLPIDFHSPCNDMGECNVWKIGGSDSLKT